MFCLFHRKKAPLIQNSPEDWRELWRGIVPPENRNVPITVDGKTIVAFLVVNHFAVMLQDGLLMEESFFGVCEHFMKAGYHVVWIMRCTQDIHDGYLVRKKSYDDGMYGADMCTLWKWKRPTTNFDHWISDNRGATIILQHKPLPTENILDYEDHVLTRVTWATSDDPTRLVPGKTLFQTVDIPATPLQLKRWLEGASLADIGK